jgi:hypothetical protein
MVRMITLACLLVMASSSCIAQVLDDQYADLQKNFAEAYNRKDADAMASAFAEMASESRRVACSSVFNAGEWRAKLGNQPLHGYYTAIIVRDGNQAKIMEETVTIAAPGQ